MVPEYVMTTSWPCAFTFTVKLIADRKSTRLNSSHLGISYAVFCLKKKNTVHHAVQESTGQEVGYRVSAAAVGELFGSVASGASSLDHGSAARHSPDARFRHNSRFV